MKTEIQWGFNDYTSSTANSITINCEVYYRKFEITKSMLNNAVQIGIIIGLVLGFLLNQNK
jgi:hypothetical protein